jgi:hypothetical protein
MHNQWCCFICVYVWERERANGKIVFSLVNSSNFASFWGNFLCHKTEKRIQVTHNLFSQTFAIKHPQRHWIYSLKTQENMHSSQHFLYLLFPNSSLKKVIHMYYSAKPRESIIWKQNVYAQTDSFVALPNLTYSKKIPYSTAVFIFKLLENLFFLVKIWG